MRQPLIIVHLLAAAMLPPLTAAAQDGGPTPATEVLTAAGFEIVAPEIRVQRLRAMGAEQRLHSVALMGAGITAGALIGVSHNQWAIDEGWVGVAMITGALVTGIYGIWDTTTWPIENVQPRIVQSTTRSRMQQRAALSAGGGVTILW